MFTSGALIGLREGLEAGIVVTIVIAFLVGRDRRREVRLVWFGVVVALLASVVAGALFAVTSARMAGRGAETFEVVASALAMVFLTSMIFWMRHSAEETRERIEGKLARALRVGPLAVFAVTVIAVVREGLEASVFVLVLGADRGGGARSLAGLLAGAAVAVALTCLLQTGLVRISVARLLTVTGLMLIVIAGGVLAHLVTSLQNLRLLPGGTPNAFHLRAIVPVDSWYGEVADGLLGVTGEPTGLALLAWFTYLVVVLTAFLRLLRVSTLRVPAAGDGR